MMQALCVSNRVFDWDALDAILLNPDDDDDDDDDEDDGASTAWPLSLSIY